MCCPQLILNLEEDYNPGTFNGSKTTRKCTDLFGLLLISATVIGLTAYCFSNSEIDKLINGYDDCGNICGKNNINTTSISFECFGKNMTEKKYIFINDSGPMLPIRECNFSCNLEKFGISNYCANDFKLIPINLNILHQLFFTICAWMPPVLFVRMIYEFYLLPKLMDIILTFLFFFMAIWIIIYIIYDLKSPTFSTIFLYMCIIFTLWILSTVLFLFTRSMSEKIRLTYILLGDVHMIIRDFKFLIWPPFIASIIVTLFFTFIMYCFIHIGTFSYLKQLNEAGATEPQIDYVKYPIASFTQILLIFAFLLFHEFVKNIQCMLVGGCVAQWYFSKRKADPTFMKQTSLNILKYHLGTICWGSILLALTFPARFIVNGIIFAVSITRKQWFCTNIRLSLSKTSCLTCFGLFSRSGFTMTAIHGSSFCAGTIRAYKLLAHNPFNAISLYTFAEWFLGFFKFLVWLILLLGYLLMFYMFKFLFQNMFTEKYYTINVVAPFLMGQTILLYFIMDLVFGILETTKDTLILCFCEDCLYNDGASKPYHMDPEFAQFVEEAIKFIDPIGWELISDIWNRGPKRLY